MKFFKSKALFNLILLTLSAVIFVSCSAKKSSEADVKTEYYLSEDKALNLCLYNIDTLNPLKTSAKNTAEVLSLLYDSLYIPSLEFYPTPSLCENFSVSADGLVCTLKIKDGVCFQNEKKLTAEDVVYSLNTIISSSGYYKKRLPFIQSAWGSGTSVKIRLSRPVANLYLLLDFPIIPKNSGNSEEGGILTTVIPGSGLYSVLEYNTNHQIKLTVNKNHHSGVMPYIENINIKFVKDRDTALSMMENGQLDMVTGEVVDIENYTPRRKLNFLDYNGCNLVFLAMNTKESEINTSLIRSSIFSLIDAQNILDEINLDATISPFPVHPDSYLYDKDFGYKNSLSRLGFNDKDGNGYLEKVKNGKKYELSYELLTVEGNPKKEYMAKIIKEMLSKNGIKIKIRTLPYDKFKLAVAKNDYEMLLAEAELLPNFDFWDLKKLINFEHDDTLAELEKKLCAETDVASLKGNYRRLFSIYQKKAFMFGLYFKKETLIHNDRVSVNKISSLNPYKSLSDFMIIK